MPGPARYTSRMIEALSHQREFELSDESATLALGGLVAGKAQATQVIVLRGDLGAGKTTFRRGVLGPKIDQNRIQNKSKFKTIIKSEKVAHQEPLGAVLGRS